MHDSRSGSVNVCTPLREPAAEARLAVRVKRKHSPREAAGDSDFPTNPEMRLSLPPERAALMSAGAPEMRRFGSLNH